MPNCNACGNPVADGAPFCLSCGAAQGAPAEPPLPAAVVPAPPSPAPQPPAQGPPASWPSAPVGSAPPPDQVQPPPAYAPAYAPAPAPPPAAYAPPPQAYAPAVGQPAAGQPAGAAPPPAVRHGGLPGWAIALIVIAVIVVVVVPVLLFIAPFYFVGHFFENFTPMIENQIAISNEKAVRQGVGDIQIGVEAWATDHDGKYPLVGQVDRTGLTQPDGLGYVTSWPGNPYAGGPMTAGSGAGQYLYVRGLKGKSYTLTGYGQDGTILITVP